MTSCNISCSTSIHILFLRRQHPPSLACTDRRKAISQNNQIPRPYVRHLDCSISSFCSCRDTMTILSNTIFSWVSPVFQGHLPAPSQSREARTENGLRVSFNLGNKKSVQWWVLKEANEGGWRPFPMKLLLVICSKKPAVTGMITIYTVVSDWVYVIVASRRCKRRVIYIHTSFQSNLRNLKINYLQYHANLCQT